MGEKVRLVVNSLAWLHTHTHIYIYIYIYINDLRDGLWGLETT